MACPQCFSGHVNSGTPKGQIATVFGRKTYVAEPAAGKKPQGIIVIVPDAFGLPFVNNQILADHYAAAGQYLVYLPDFMDGKEAKVQTMINMAHMWDAKTSWFSWPYYVGAVMIDFVPFLIRNRLGVAWPRVTDFLSALREEKGATLPVGVAGFCWGGLYAIKLTHDDPSSKTAKGQPLADACFAAHASSVTFPTDIEAVKLPLSIANGDNDAVMNIKQVQQAKQILSSKNDVDTEVVIYPGAKHGFAVRASRAVPDSEETRQAEEAEKQAIAWFQRQFAAVKEKYSGL